MRRRVLITVAIAAITLGVYLSSGVWWTGSGGEPLVQDTSQFQTGDLLFVRGMSWRSRIVLLINGGGSDFSHVGLVWRRNGRPFVIHATPTSSDKPEGGGVMVDPLRKFLSTKHVLQAALYRVKDRKGDIAKRAAATAQRYAAQALPFDHEFDASTSSKLYCTELIWRAYREAELNLLSTFSESASDPLLPAALSQSRLLTEVARFQ